MGVRSHGGMNVRGGVAFGHNPHFSVFVNSHSHYYRPHYSYRRYPYPYVVYSYPLAYYGAYDFLDDYTYSEPQPQTVYVPYPVYTNSADVGLDTQMRQQQLGMYAQPAQPATADSYPNRAPGVDTSKPYPQRAPAATVSQPDQPATVLVYRDGHSAEIRNYAVVGQTLWIFSEERAQKVALSLLDVEATRKANDARGVEFPVIANR